MEQSAAVLDHSTLDASCLPDPPKGLKVSLIPPNLIDWVWAQAGPHLQMATDQSEGRFVLRDVYDRLITGDWHLWVVYEETGNLIASITSSFSWYPQGKWLSGQFLGGDRLDEWRDLFCDTFDRFARDMGCKAIEFTGRPGWGRRLKPNGYRELFRVYQRDL